MKVFLLVAGGALMVAGIVWLLQGLNVLPGSFMTGQVFWAWAGGVSLLVGGALLFLGLNRRTPA
jgi:hypothetical protein